MGKVDITLSDAESGARHRIASAPERTGSQTDEARSFERLSVLRGWVLLDLNIPKVDGLEVLRRLKADPRTRTIVVVILTSSKEERDLATGYRMGAKSYIQKPVDFDQFRAVIEKVGFYWLLINEPSENPCPLALLIRSRSTSRHWTELMVLGRRNWIHNDTAKARSRIDKGADSNLRRREVRQAKFCELRLWFRFEVISCSRHLTWSIEGVAFVTSLREPPQAGSTNSGFQTMRESVR
jgi:CheY-like chemotaxis protein